MLAVHVYVFYVYFYLFVGASLRDLDASLLDASADLGAGAWTTFRRVVLPLLRPALVGASLLAHLSHSRQKEVAAKLVAARAEVDAARHRGRLGREERGDVGGHPSSPTAVNLSWEV